MSSAPLFLAIFILILTLQTELAQCAETGTGTTTLTVSDDESSGAARYTIEGRVYAADQQFQQTPANAANNWQANARLHVNGGEYLGFVREDGSFVVHNLPSGSYILEVLHPLFAYEPVRVEINAKGKYRARKVNHIMTSQVIQMPYPLLMKPLGRTRYFHVREQWRITDFLMNPMILMMVVPLLLIMVLPKMMNDPETKKEMEQISSMTKFDMPEVSDYVTNFLAGGQAGSSTGTQGDRSSKKSIKQKKKQ